MLRLPNFFLVGAPKAGTTSLYYYLDQHPGIYMSPVKEPHYFAEEIRKAYCDSELRRGMARENRGLRRFLSSPMREKRVGGIITDWEDYLRLFANAIDEPARGEASVCYLWSPTAPARIAEKIPGAKILAMLRDPADRAFSQYLHGLGNGSIRWSFREHIQRNLRHRTGCFCVHYPFLEFGEYAEQLSRYQERFGRNLWIGFYEDFQERPVEMVHNIFRFLDVAPEFSPDMSQRHREAQIPRSSAIGWLQRSGLWQATARVTPPGLRPLIRRRLIRGREKTRIAPADRRYLVDFYRAGIRKLEGLTGRSLDAWLRYD
ncbi:MAG TPA: sulfotransferase [Bryobacteraceae bacterium]|nr:sulfotransferase [Bryobacteraceae bacterium]